MGCPRLDSVAFGSCQRPRGGGESPGGGGVAGGAKRRRQGASAAEYLDLWPWRFVVGFTWWQPAFKMQIKLPVFCTDKITRFL